ncbi:MAG: DNA phosphorothioation-associated protein 4 [Oscillatoriaceae bacterium SKW80]|nr:DNA phosphorothioation-associated protein 4 [Oscillatoriaceae bacterium SKYG93]MCX8121262.1 DNA phosphorothioation-associated protein 4 [Oscillatoriaceae bacterium SKW80]MDW8453404.1 DNA phosphorothioation-associated protein 4 [Oscillatoriaceae cyanobacterium SKYGB_i_bin93]HIK26759.1 DNA phosphorothioation-associated protein 4 [Oscillatoriaceae cyanobacterium M7585_C2015_266]
MGATRIKIAKDKADLVKDLTKEANGPFHTYADAIAFAAALGAKRKKRLTLNQISKEPGPIDLDIFISRGYDLEIKLIALAETKEPKMISQNDEEAEKERIQIFEEYANGGLEILKEKLRGFPDYTEGLLLILFSERDKQEQPEEEFDLSRFLT